MSETPHQAKPDFNDIDDGLRDRCLQYLLGELNADEEAAFVEQVEKIPSLDQELLAQAELICLLGTRKPQRVDDPLIADTTHVDTGFWKDVPRVHFLRLIAAVAASVLIAFFLFPSRRDQKGTLGQLEPQSDRVNEQSASSPALDEASMIAQAWAEGPLSLSWNIDGEADLTDERGDRHESDDAIGEWFGPSDDCAFDWMMVAVSAEGSTDG